MKVGSVVGMAAFYPLDTLRSRIQAFILRENYIRYALSLTPDGTVGGSMGLSPSECRGPTTKNPGHSSVASGNREPDRIRRDIHSRLEGTFLVFTWKVEKRRASKPFGATLTDPLLQSLGISPSGSTGSSHVTMSAIRTIRREGIPRPRREIQPVNDTQLKGSPWELLTRMANEEGIESLYRGLSPVLQSLSVSNFVYFYSFHALRKVVSNDNSAIKDLLIGIAAGSINVLLTSPLWVVNTRMKLDKTSYSSLLGGLIDIAKKEGAKGLWSGTIPSLLLVSNPAVQFMVYETLKRDLVTRGRFDTYAAFLVGAIAKAVATTVTYPLQLVQSKLRAGANMNPLMKDLKSNPLVMFRGLEAKLLQTVMTAALMFLIYEKLVRLVLSIMRVKLVKRH
ncbi:unnamed protein product [Diatraea saccharalis]|uniref:Peroxisomal membrane protein PMP34 n=1 Tax=Diatraea saccharalis TaxID=40085 RepID=A0A9N9RD45_9NEOP|nr:unnamed protein product [Diatraea saccharalis]